MQGYLATCRSASGLTAPSEGCCLGPHLTHCHLWKMLTVTCTRDLSPSKAFGLMVEESKVTECICLLLHPMK